MRGVIAVCVLLAACSSGETKEESDKKKLAAFAERVSTGPFTDIKPSELVYSYRTNSVAADAAYKGTVLRVVGVVDRVGQDANGVPLVVLRDLDGTRETELLTVRCGWNGDRSVAASFTPGTKVVVAGIGGGLAAGDPIILFCDKNTSPLPEAKLVVADTTNSPNFWRGNIDMFLNGKDVKKYKLTYAGTNNNEATIETEMCDRAKLAVEQLGSIPHGFKVNCVSAKGVQWTLENK